MTSKSHHTLMTLFRDKCRQHHLKITPQRTAIYEELIRSRDHPSAVNIFTRIRKIFPDISFDTVNRTLLTFSEIGIASVVEGYGQPKRFDTNTESHHHFRCVKCNTIVDFHSKPFDRVRIPEDVQKRFTILRKRVVLEGICDKCSRKT
jgi:Fur family peroxide stress response transcriptional regulator